MPYGRYQCNYLWVNVWLMDLYPDSMSKMALALTSAQLAKDLMVQEHGIGEDLAFNFFGWQDDQLIIVSQLKRSLMGVPMVERLNRCGDMCKVLRSYWGITAISMIAEGYETLDKQKLNGRELRQAFIEDPNLVQECVTVTHCEPNEVTGDLELTLVSVPYSYAVAKEVLWGDALGYTRGTETILRSSPVPQMLIASLNEEVIHDIEIQEIDRILESLVANGFIVDEF